MSSHVLVLFPKVCYFHSSLEREKALDFFLYLGAWVRHSWDQARKWPNCPPLGHFCDCEVVGGEVMGLGEVISRALAECQ